MSEQAPSISKLSPASRERIGHLVYSKAKLLAFDRARSHGRAVVFDDLVAVMGDAERQIEERLKSMGFSVTQ